MYRIIYTKQAAKDVEKLKSCRLDRKAKELIEVVRRRVSDSQTLRKGTSNWNCAQHPAESGTKVALCIPLWNLKMF